jgi:hypothetical protein
VRSQRCAHVLECPRLSGADRRKHEPTHHVVNEVAYGTSRLKIRVTTMSRN